MIHVSCATCGKQFQTMDSNAGRLAKCPNCGSAITVPGAVAQAAPMPPSEAAAPVTAGAGAGGLAIAGMVLGIVALILSFIPCLNWLGFLPALVGLILSIIALVTAKKAGRSKGAAIAGLVCSALAIIWIPLYILVILGGAAGAFSAMPR